jgi:hypothetical protein
MSGIVNFEGTDEEWDALVEKNKLRLSSMKKQTAVEWLEQELKKLPFVNVLEVFAKAKAMEKEQIIEAYKQCENSHVSWECDGSQDYYTSTYGS